MNENVQTSDQSVNEISLIRLAEVSRLTTLRNSTIFKAIKNKTMPRPIKLLGVNVWDKQEILSWINSQRQ